MSSFSIPGPVPGTGALKGLFLVLGVVGSAESYITDHFVRIKDYLLPCSDCGQVQLASFRCFLLVLYHISVHLFSPLEFQ